MDWESKLQSWCEKIGASHAGLTTLQTPVTWRHYEDWIRQGFSADMEYLKTHAEWKKHPQKWKPELQSALVFAFPYIPHPEFEPVFSQARTALYAQGHDYHHWIKARLQKLIDELSLEYPGEKFETHTDSSPLLERDLAERAGLGWFGKNTCLIHPQKGSLFLIGEILTTLKFEHKPEPLPDFCGKCQKCLEICPTKALQSPHILDASKCISYLTIESRGIPAKSLRHAMGDWLFGCDLCQTACPWNQKVFKNKLQVSPVLELSDADVAVLVQELRWLLTSSHNQILKKIKGTPLSRAGAKGLKRNALIVVANRRMHSLTNEVLALCEDEHLGELARWARDCLDL